MSPTRFDLTWTNDRDLAHAAGLEARHVATSPPGAWGSPRSAATTMGGPGHPRAGMRILSGPWRVASQSRLEGIFETGRRLIEIRRKYQDENGKFLPEREGDWSRLIGFNEWVGQSLLPFEKSHSQRLIRIADHAHRLVPHAGLLPDDSTTLSKLVSLSDERFQELLNDGTINQNMGRNDMSEPPSWPSYPPARPRPGRTRPPGLAVLPSAVSATEGGEDGRRPLRIRD